VADGHVATDVDRGAVLASVFAHECVKFLSRLPPRPDNPFSSEDSNSRPIGPAPSRSGSFGQSHSSA
jgi:hypothetical protein